MIADAIRIVHETPKNKMNQGEVAKFINLGNGWGFKFYKREETCNRTHTLQGKAAEYKLAPNVGEKTIFMMDGCTYYGYLTETAKVVKDEYAKSIGVHPNDIWNGTQSDSDRADDHWEEMYKLPEYRELSIELESKGFNVNDLHWGNVGYMPDGRMVMIDFDCDW